MKNNSFYKAVSRDVSVSNLISLSFIILYYIIGFLFITEFYQCQSSDDKLHYFTSASFTALKLIALILFILTSTTVFRRVRKYVLTANNPDIGISEFNKIISVEQVDEVLLDGFYLKYGNINNSLEKSNITLDMLCDPNKFGYSKYLIAELLKNNRILKKLCG